MTVAMTDLPEPRGERLVGHLPRWGSEPVRLLEEGARHAKIFRLRLGVPAVVGYAPGWNKRILTDLEGFVSAGSFSRIVPYLAGGIIMTDAPQHKPRKAALNKPFNHRAMQALRERVRSALHATTPVGEFDALAWADRAVLAMLNAAYFSGEFNPRLLHAFLAPLRRPFPTPVWPRPVLFARTNAELRRLSAARDRAGGDDLLTHLAHLPSGLLEARVSLAAGHDTTTHTLAWALWHLAQHPQWRTPDGLGVLVKETLRLYPAGWIGSRRAARDTEIDGALVRRGTLVMYSAYLAGRDPDFWAQPEDFNPERFTARPAPWTYLPFGAGERTCLGMHLANLMIEEALSVFLEGELSAVRGDPTPRPGVTLGPAGPLIVRLRV